MRYKLSDYAKKFNVTYRTAWNRYKAGKIDNCKIDAEDTDNGIIIHVTPIIEYKCGDYVEFVNGNHGIYLEKSSIQIVRVFKENILLNSDFESRISRKLSKTEISEFNEKLTSNGYRFNVEKLKLEKLPPRSKKGSSFYCMSRTFECLKSTDNRDETSNKLYDSGNYFLESVNCKEFIKRVINNR